MKKFSAAPICEGALAAALTVILTLAGMYVPALGIFAMLLSGIPLMWLIIRRGVYVSATALIAALALIFALTGDLISGPVGSALSLLPYMTAGFCIRKRYRYFSTLAAVTIANLFGYLIMIMILNAVSGNNYVTELIDGYFGAVKDMMGTYLSGAGAGAMGETLTASLDAAKTAVLSYFPSILIIAALISGYIILSLGIFFAKRLRVSGYAYLPFSAIRLPKSMLIIAIVLMLLSFFTTDTSVYTLALKNIVAVISFVLAVGGLSVVDYKLSKKISSGYKRFLIYLLVFVLGYIFISLIFYALMLVGMLDSNLNLRASRRAGDDGEK